jgi:hypothetical protein
MNSVGYFSSVAKFTAATHGSFTKPTSKSRTSSGCENNRL